MPLTPRSRVYEQKLANSQKKAKMRDEMAKSRFKGNTKPVESFSTPVAKEPMINAGLRGANFQRGGLAVEGAKTLLDWDTLKSAAQEPTNTAKGFGKIALLSMGPAAAAGVLGPKEALAAMLMQDSDVQKAGAVTGILPMGSAQRLAARSASKAMYAFEPSVMSLGSRFADDVENFVDPIEDMAARNWELGRFEPASESLSKAWLDRGKNTSGVTEVKDVPPAALQGLSYGLAPSELSYYSDDIMRNVADPSKTKPGETIQVVWNREGAKDSKQLTSTARGGVTRTAKSAALDKKYIVPDEGIDNDLAVKEFENFRNATGMPAEIRVLNEDGSLRTTLNPHVDHFMSASAIGAYARKLQEAGNPSLATKISKAVNSQDNMLVYFSKTNTEKGRTSPFVWKEQLRAKAPEYFDRVHGKNSYADKRYSDAEKYWKGVFGEKEYDDFVEWYNNASLNKTDELYPENVIARNVPRSMQQEYARAMQGY